MMEERIYLKIVIGEWSNASRDRRELRAITELGYRPLVIASTKKEQTVCRENVEGFDVIRIPTRKYGLGIIQTVIGKMAAIGMYIHEAQKINADIISGHNYTGWVIGYLSHGKKSKYVYDSHEFELCQTAPRSFLGYHIVKMIENFILHHSDINMMVTDSIADEVQKIYKLTKRPLVVRNIPPLSADEIPDCQKRRQEFMKHLNISEQGMILMYHGLFAQNRGIEETISAVARLNDIGLVIMGYALDKDYECSLIQLIKHLECQERVYVKAAVPFSELYENVAAADVGVILIQNTCTSFLYSLPNKLFENIQAMTPVIGSDFPEIGSIISKYDIGIKIRPDDIDALVNAINLMKDNKKLYKNFKENLKIAKMELCWEKEKERLLNAISNI